MKHLTPLKKISLKRTRYLKYGALLLVLLPMFSFGKQLDREIDKIPPKIDLRNPACNIEVVRGENLHFNAFLQDDQELDSYRLVITKGGMNSDQFADAFSSYYKKDALGNALPEIGGAKSRLLDFYIKVDENAIVGDYDLCLTLKDKAGNEQIVKRSFNVAHH